MLVYSGRADTRQQGSRCSTSAGNVCMWLAPHIFCRSNDHEGARSTDFEVTNSSEQADLKIHNRQRIRISPMSKDADGNIVTITPPDPTWMEGMLRPQVLNLNSPDIWDQTIFCCGQRGGWGSLLLYMVRCLATFLTSTR